MVNVVVRLERNERCVDPLYLDMLRGVREGKPTAEHEDLLKSRVYDSLLKQRDSLRAAGKDRELAALDAQLLKFAQLHCPTIVGLCDVRYGIGAERLVQAAHRSKQQLYVAQSKDLRSVGGTQLPLPARLQARLRRAKDSMLRYSQGKLPLLPGTWYVITDNSAFAPELGIAKGSQLRLDRIVLHPREPAAPPTSDGVVFLKEFPILIMHYPQSRLVRPLSGMPDIYTIPITPFSVSADVPLSILFGRKMTHAMAKQLDEANQRLAESFQYAKTLCIKCKQRQKPKRARLCLECKAESEGATGPTWTIHRTQFPLRPANSHTAHTIQGQTFRDGCSVDLHSQSTPANYAYVLLSRVTKREDLLILREFDWRSLHRKPNKELVLEDKRLHKLATATRVRFAALFKTHCSAYPPGLPQVPQFTYRLPLLTSCFCVTFCVIQGSRGHALGNQTTR